MQMKQNLQKSDAKCAKKCLPAASSSGPPCQPSPAAARRGGGAARQVAAGEVAPEKNRYDRDDQRVGGQGNNGFLKETLEKVKKRGDVGKNIKMKHSCGQKNKSCRQINSAKQNCGQTSGAVWASCSSALLPSASLI